MADIYRADHVGSLLRPESLKEARNMFYAGGMSADTLRESEDAAILEALAQQERIGVAVFTDGEFRRSGFQNDMQDAVEGFIDTGTPAVAYLERAGRRTSGARHAAGGGRKAPPQASPYWGPDRISKGQGAGSGEDDCPQSQSISSNLLPGWRDGPVLPHAFRPPERIDRLHQS